MLNNKKNLLQRVRIAMVAIVAILGVGGAFAMQVPQHKDAVSYGVLSTDATYYYVTDVSSGFCAPSSSNTCTVSSMVAPVDGKIRKDQATAGDTGIFTQ